MKKGRSLEARATLTTPTRTRQRVLLKMDRVVYRRATDNRRDWQVRYQENRVCSCS